MSLRSWSTAAAVLVALLAGCDAGDDHSSSASASSTTSTPPSASAAEPTDDDSAEPEAPRDPRYVTSRTTTGSQPCGIVGGAGQVWVSNYGDNTLVAIDPKSGELGRPIPVGASPCGLAYGAGSIWVENYGENTVTRVNATTGKVEATIDVGSAPYDVTFGSGAAWVTNFTGFSISRIDPQTNRSREIRVGGTPIGIAPTPGAVWVGAGPAGLVKVDAASGKVVERLHLKGSAGWTAYAGNSVWVGVDDTVVQVDAATDRVVATTPVGSQPLDGDVLGQTAWVPDGSGDLYRIGRSTGRAAKALRSTAANPFVLCAYQQRIWVVDFAGTDVVSIDPSKVR